MFTWIKRPRYKYHFNNGPVVELVYGNGPYKISFIDDKETVYQDWLEPGEWAKADQKYLKPWTIQIATPGNRCLQSHRFDITGKTVRINLDSKSLGDTLAWVPQVAKFAESYPETTVFISQFWENLIDTSAYPQLQFIPPEENLSDCYATFNIGYYFNNIRGAHKTDPRKLSLGAVAADILGLEYEELRPKLIGKQKVQQVPNRVCIATRSTAGCKEWLNPDGWQEVTDWLVEQNHEVMVIQQEPTNLNNIVDKTGDFPITDRIQQLKSCSFFVGLGSGLSWLAWACHKPVILISGFSLPYTEFTDDCHRVIETSVCHGCWNNVEHQFERGNWDWCPEHGGTSRAFECTREITSKTVIQAIQNIIKPQ